MFGSYTKRDMAQDRADRRRDRRRAENAKKMEAWLPFRMGVLARVKAGEISLEEAKLIISKKEKEET